MLKKYEVSLLANEKYNIADLYPDVVEKIKLAMLELSTSENASWNPPKIN
ncbi:hypothetical protein GLIP_1165 [Aliiglaciecola lipolytica E3]|uniref:Uncharacterized protein n=1 Tax=Aliiglaciecola lipolytica E3 TaxID=1127673 RepID=K6XQ75_9ALTE|nr:hypothetical protein GLIP_1165 [Aliiglaciecola lipolytica E3]